MISVVILYDVIITIRFWHCCLLVVYYVVCGRWRRWGGGVEVMLLVETTDTKAVETFDSTTKL